MNENKLYKEVYNKICEYNKIIIHRHERPDGDALGAQIGLKEAILSTFPTKDVKVVGDDSERLKWIIQIDEIDDEFYHDALVIVVDTGAEKLISDKRYNLGEYLIKIDHHVPQGEYGDLSLVDTSFESCAGLVADFIFECQMSLSDAGANALFLGIVTDSGRFRYSSTTPKTFSIASKLMEYNLNTEYIYKMLYTEKLENVKLKAELIQKFKITTNGVAYLINTQEDIKKYQEINPNVTINDVSRGMVNIMSGIENILIWVNFTEDVNKAIYVEMRSSGANVCSVATKHGGGGHLQASGCTVYSFEEVEQIIQELDNLLLV